MEIKTILWIIYFSVSILTYILWIWDLYIDTYSPYTKANNYQYKIEMSFTDILFSSLVISFVPLINIILLTVSVRDLILYYIPKKNDRK